MAAHSLSRLPIHSSRLTCERRERLVLSSSTPSLSYFSSNCLENPWLVGTPLAPTLSLRVSNPNRFLAPKQRPVVAAVTLSLPTAKPERLANEKLPKWSWRAIKSFGMGQLEARKLKYATIGTEGLLMGILTEGTSLAAQYLRAHGITLTKVREESVKIIPKGPLSFYLVDLPPLTEEAQRVLDWAVDEKLKSGEDGEITTTDMLLGIWSEKGSPGQKILATLGFDDEKAKEIKFLSSKPGFDKG